MLSGNGPCLWPYALAPLSPVLDTLFVRKVNLGVPDGLLHLGPLSPSGGGRTRARASGGGGNPRFWDTLSFVLPGSLTVDKRLLQSEGEGREGGCER